jgi:hypothetical protein
MAGITQMGPLFKIDLHSKNYENGDTKVGLKLIESFNYDCSRNCDF